MISGVRANSQVSKQSPLFVITLCSLSILLVLFTDDGAEQSSRECFSEGGYHKITLICRGFHRRQVQLTKSICYYVILVI